jgi:hypothetical protein
MTTQHLAGEVSVAEILAGCDHVMGEIGRRRHMFGWLRLPDAAADEWLVVDAYYPGNRVVVARRGEHDALLSERVPAHGLRLLLLDPESLSAEPGGVNAAIRGMLSELPAVTRPTGRIAAGAPAEPRESAVARAFASATAKPKRSRAALSLPAADPAPPERAVAAGVAIGVALTAVLCAEIYLGLTELALGSGHVVLAFGIALDACARVLGTVAASRSGHRPWILPCVIGGSPAVALFALFQDSGPVSTDPAPLAGLLSLVAMGVVGLALVAMVLGM